MSSTDLRSFALHWKSVDPDPETAAQIDSLLEDESALQDHFGARLQFGTAGLRGALGPGPNRINRVLVRRVARGLAAALQVPGTRIVIGFDGRKNSRVFATDSARVLADAGYDVLLFDTVCPTPVLAHAVVYMGASAGIMVTASHNPPGDNGYKVYSRDGAQIVPPFDAQLSAAIDAVDTDAEPGPLDAERSQGSIQPVPPATYNDYVKKVLALRVHPTNQPDIKVVYTAMHGVGTDTVMDVLGRAGHTLVGVPEQARPDAAFPTVAFPNPEEPGALDLAIALAQKAQADVIVANDPDADRLAVVVPTDDGWRPMTGNEIGSLLGEDLLANTEPGERLVATTLVSSTLLSRIAEHHKATYAETLTGFKWIAHAAMPFDAQGGRFILGYEEALGYSAGSVVRDKDGVSAILLLCDLVSHLKANGRSLLDALADLYQRHGVHAGRQVSQKAAGAAGKAKITAMMAHLRDTEVASFAGSDVVRRTDVLTGTAIDLQTGELARIQLPQSNVLAWNLADGSRILARPSGTEPKIKFYFEAVVPMGDDALVDAEQRAHARLDELEAAFRAHAGPL